MCPFFKKLKEIENQERGWHQIQHTVDLTQEGTEGSSQDEIWLADSDNRSLDWSKEGKNQLQLKPRFLPPENDHNNNTYFIKWLQRLNKLSLVKCLEQWLTFINTSEVFVE